jgi:short-subunit dehydrogenase
MIDFRVRDVILSFRLDGRRVVITGASEGIGREFALSYSRAGTEVVLVSRRLDKLLKVSSKIVAEGGKVHVIAADLNQMNHIRSVARKVSRFIAGRNLALVLLNNAGFAFTKAALAVTGREWDQVLRIHARATFFCSQRFAPMMMKRGYGKIINLSSTWSVSSDDGKSVYGAAKAAVSYLTAACLLNGHVLVFESMQSRRRQP